MAIDPIVAEVRRARKAYAKQFNYDVYAMGRDLQERQQKSGRTVVALPPKRLEPSESDPALRRREAPNHGMEVRSVSLKPYPTDMGDREQRTGDL